ncbi:MAG: hypothetical protein GKR77_07910 [Legionellales bacterium]|nr:hypothetical protein [Legionellales bacterium]
MKKCWRRWRLKSLNKKVESLLRQRQNNPVSDADIAKEIQLHMAIGHIYDQHRFDKKIPYAERLALESYRAAAALENPQAQYIVGERLMEFGKFWDRMQTSLYGCQAHKKYAEQAYQEAFVYLEACDKQQYPKAKRLQGLAWINGWGVEKDFDKGVAWVVDSIEMEGKWDQLTDILTKIELNTPDFFASIRKAREARRHME